MLLKDAFKEEPFMGYNVAVQPRIEKGSSKRKIIPPDSIQYTIIIPTRLREMSFVKPIKEKYNVQEGDILIYLRKPYRVGVVTHKFDEEVIVPNNFFLLRGIDDKKYNYIFLANYLEQYGLHQKEYNGNLTIDDIEKIELPDIELNEQEKIVSLLKAINERSSIYSCILDNDSKIIEYALKSIVGDKE